MNKLGPEHKGPFNAKIGWPHILQDDAAKD
jgi:hypothetical protein